MLHVGPGPGPAEAEVVFTVPAHGLEHAPVAVVGDFNGWNPQANPLHRHGSTYRATLCLPLGRRYAFKYIAAGRYWFNDETRERQCNAYGGMDSILDLTGPQFPSRRRRQPSRQHRRRPRDADRDAAADGSGIARRTDGPRGGPVPIGDRPPVHRGASVLPPLRPPAMLSNPTRAVALVILRVLQRYPAIPAIPAIPAVTGA